MDIFHELPTACHVPQVEPLKPVSGGARGMGARPVPPGQPQGGEGRLRRPSSPLNVGGLHDCVISRLATSLLYYPAHLGECILKRVP